MIKFVSLKRNTFMYHWDGSSAILDYHLTIDRVKLAGRKSIFGKGAHSEI